MADQLPQDIRERLEKAAELHQRATSDYDLCQQFNQLMSALLADLEDAGCYRTADRVMTILIDCNPKQGRSCDKATRIGEKMKKFEK